MPIGSMKPNRYLVPACCAKALSFIQKLQVLKDWTSGRDLWTATLDLEDQGWKSTRKGLIIFLCSGHLTLFTLTAIWPRLVGLGGPNLPEAPPKPKSTFSTQCFV